MTRAELLARSPARPVRSLADLTPTENVWTVPTDYGDLYGQLAHRKARLKVAVCGTAISEWATSAEHVAIMHGRLCPACWPMEKEG